MLLDPQKLEPRVGVTGRPVYIRSVPGGESVMRLRLGRRLVNLLPLAPRTTTFHIGGRVVSPRLLQHRLSPFLHTPQYPCSNSGDRGSPPASVQLERKAHVVTWFGGFDIRRSLCRFAVIRASERERERRPCPPSAVTTGKRHPAINPFRTAVPFWGQIT